MKTEFYYDSCGKGQIRACRWEPEGKPKGIVQLVHGIAEHIDRYEDYANDLTDHGYVVVAEDHMGHGRSVEADGVKGYFTGGWFSAVEDTYKLLEQTQALYPDIPYYLFGHSMGSFMVRTILIKHPEAVLAGCVICGTAWQPAAVLSAGLQTANMLCRMSDPQKPSKLLHLMAFGSYNRRVERPLTPSDWLTRDRKVVQAYVSDPMCGFVASAGLMRDMFTGIAYIQRSSNLAQMRRDLPVLFVAGGDDPVGAYGDGVLKASEAFKNAGMENVSLRIYPLCRHEILNEINRKEIYRDIHSWFEGIGKRS